MSAQKLDTKQLHDLLYQMLETEQGGQKVYETALRCAVQDDLCEEWQGYLEETRRHEQVVRSLCEAMGLDPAADTPSRLVLRHINGALLQAMEMALQAGDPAAAQLVACECVVHAETKDHANWELLGRVAEVAGPRTQGEQLREAHGSVEKEEDHHLYHSKGWCRELWIEALGMPAVLPPPEEVKQVETAIGASRAEQARTSLL